MLWNWEDRLNLWTWWHHAKLHKMSNKSFNRAVDDLWQICGRPLNKMYFSQDHFCYFKNSKTYKFSFDAKYFCSSTYIWKACLVIYDVNTHIFFFEISSPADVILDPATPIISPGQPRPAGQHPVAQQLDSFFF